VLPLCFAGFLVFGVGLVLIGSNQAELARALGLDLERTGLLAAVLVLGIGVGVVAAGPLVDRFPRRPLWIGAMGLAAAALLGVTPHMSFERLLFQLALAGAGMGLYDTMISTLVVERYRERAARPMSIVHSAVTVGAVAGPLLAGWLTRHFGWSATFQIAGALHVALAAAGLAVSLPAPARAMAPATGAPVRRDTPFSAALLPFALAIFGYVGIESAVTVFAVPYATQAHALSEARGLASISAFWLGLFAGRMLPLALPFAPGAGAVAAAGAAGAAVFALNGGVGSPELVFGAAGLTLGCVYPVVIALAGERFPDARGTATGLTAGFGAIGGFTIPWLHGAIGDGLGVRTAVGTLAVWALLIAAAALLARRDGRRKRLERADAR
jgi:MFS family permease